jgi:hypothetical protein
VSPPGTILPPGHHPSTRRGFEIVLILLARDAQRAQLRRLKTCPRGPTTASAAKQNARTKCFFINLQRGSIRLQRLEELRGLGAFNRPTTRSLQPLARYSSGLPRSSIERTRALQLSSELSSLEVRPHGGREPQRSACPSHHVLITADLAGGRDAAELPELPAAERKHWQTLCADVDDPIAKTNGK